MRHFAAEYSWYALAYFPYQTFTVPALRRNEEMLVIFKCQHINICDYNVSPPKGDGELGARHTDTREEHRREAVTLSRHR